MNTGEPKDEKAKKVDVLAVPPYVSRLSKHRPLPPSILLVRHHPPTVIPHTVRYEMYMTVIPKCSCLLPGFPATGASPPRPVEMVRGCLAQ